MSSASELKAEAESPAVHRKPRLLCYGDSLTAGYIALTKYNDSFAPWGPHLADALECIEAVKSWDQENDLEMNTMKGKSAFLRLVLGNKTIWRKKSEESRGKGNTNTSG